MRIPPFPLHVIRLGFVFAVLVSIGAVGFRPTPAFCQGKLTITTASGKTYEGTVKRVTTEGIVFLHTGGVATIPRAELPDFLKKAVDAEIARVEGEKAQAAKMEADRKAAEATKANEVAAMEASKVQRAEVLQSKLDRFQDELDRIQERDEGKALELAKAIVLKSLKAPSTAAFPDDSCSVKHMSNHVWMASGEVDAENSFGARLRTAWSVQFNLEKPKVYFLMLGGELTGSAKEAEADLAELHEMGKVVKELEDLRASIRDRK